MQRVVSHLLFSGVVDQTSMVAFSAISDSSTNYHGKNVTGNYHVDNSSDDIDVT